MFTETTHRFCKMKKKGATSIRKRNLLLVVMAIIIIIFTIFAIVFIVRDNYQLNSSNIQYLTPSNEEIDEYFPYAIRIDIKKSFDVTKIMTIIFLSLLLSVAVVYLVLSQFGLKGLDGLIFKRNKSFIFIIIGIILLTIIFCTIIDIYDRNIKNSKTNITQTYKIINEFKTDTDMYYYIEKVII